MSVDFRRLSSVFMAESSLQLDRLNQLVLDLERNPHEQGVLDDLFRNVHSLKGGAASLGFDDVTTLAHEMESYLHVLREGAAAIDTAAIDLLLAGLDSLRVLLDGYRSSEDSSPPISVIEEARACAQRFHSAAQGLPPAEDLTEHPFRDSCREEIRQVVSEGREVFLVTIVFEDSVQMMSVRAYLLFSNVERGGSVVAERPERDRIDDDFRGRLHLVVALHEGSTMEHLEESCRIDQVEEVQVTPWWDEETESDDQGGTKQCRKKGQGSGRTDSFPGGSPLAVGGDGFLRVDIAKVDSLLHGASELWSLRAKLRGEVKSLREEIGSRRLRALEDMTDRYEVLVESLRDEIMGVRMVPVREVFLRFPRLVRDVARATGKDVRFLIEGETTELDKMVVESLADPLVHLLRNAVDHGIETPQERLEAGKPPQGMLRLCASQQGPTILIQVEDDGRGVDFKAVRTRIGEVASDAEVCETLFEPGFSTKDHATLLSGRGVGLDAVRTVIASLNGTVTLCTTPHRGVRVSIRVPLTLALTSVLMVRVADETYALPVAHVKGTLETRSPEVFSVAGRGAYVQQGGQILPYARLADLVDCDSGRGHSSSASAGIVHVECGDVEALIEVDAFVGHEELIMRPLAENFRTVPGISGASFLPDGQVILVLDLTECVTDLAAGERERSVAQG